LERIPGNAAAAASSSEAIAAESGGWTVKIIEVQEANLKRCVRDAQRERVLLTRKGKPVAVLVGVQGLDLEQIELGLSDKFWALINERRKEKTISREELERRLEVQE
jgi:PHD/YefM family antitoxin component YafN of YafNO toxin-antitoxin module